MWGHLHDAIDLGRISAAAPNCARSRQFIDQHPLKAPHASSNPSAADAFLQLHETAAAFFPNRIGQRTVQLIGAGTFDR